MPELPGKTDVLILGAGPCGLTLAAALRRLGAEPLVIDRLAEGANTSRAAVVHARTLEVLDALLVTQDLLAEGLRVPTFRLRDGARILSTVSFSALPTDYPFSLMIPQDRTEAILTRRLHELGGAVLRPAEALAIRAQEQGVEVDIEHEGHRRTVTARWLVGCDGAHSLARETSGIAFAGGTYEQDFVLADIHMAWGIGRDEVTLFLSPEGMLLVAPLPGAEDLYRLVATVEHAPPELEAALMQGLLDRRAAVGQGHVRSLVWGSRFHIHHRVTATPRAGRILLCGDAAHLHSPAGGQGMNTGIQDAMALAEPLIEALRSGRESGLDEWAASRHEVARKVVGLTDRMTRAALLSSPAARLLRNGAISFVSHIPAAQDALARALAELHND